MLKTLMRKAIFILHLIVMYPLFAGCNATDHRQYFDSHTNGVRLNEALVADNEQFDNLIDIFKAAPDIADIGGNGFYIISDQVMDYLETCCKEKQRAIAQMKSEGFKVGENIAERLNGRDGNYSEIYTGKKVSTLVPGFFVRVYILQIYINDGVVQKVYAKTERSGP
jgi:hypothetical protein